MKYIRTYITITLLLVFVLGLSACKNEKENEVILNQTTLDKIEALETKYNITIQYGDATIDAKVDYKYSLSYDTEKIDAAVNATDIIFGRLPEDWAEVISNMEIIPDDSYKVEKVHFVFCDYIEGVVDEYGGKCELKGNFGFSEDSSEIYYMVNIHDYEPKIAIAETITYRMVNKIVNDDQIKVMIMETEEDREIQMENALVNKLASCNPENFEYYGMITDVKDEHRQYLYGGTDDLSNVYFINEEAMISQYTDFVQLISPLLYTDEDEELPEVYKSEHVYAKTRTALWSINDISFFNVDYLNQWIFEF